MLKAIATPSTDLMRIRTAGRAARHRHPDAPVPSPVLAILRADRDRLPRWG